MLELLKEKVLTCTKCPDLVQSRSQVVFSKGNPNTRVVFVGESPGSTEDREGHPFCGASGKLLDELIELCGWTRQDVYIINTVNCHPEWNRNPYPQEVKNCRSYLDLQLKIVQPDIIVCLGAVAAQNLLNTEQSVYQLRKDWHYYQGIKVRVTFHPAFILRKMHMKNNMLNDLQLVVELIRQSVALVDQIETNDPTGMYSIEP